MRRAACIVLVAAALCACRTDIPGHLSAISTRALDIPMRVVARGAEGRACGSDTQRNIPAAIQDALARYPGANALANVSVYKEPRCIRVSGTAVEVLGASPATTVSP